MARGIVLAVRLVAVAVLVALAGFTGAGTAGAQPRVEPAPAIGSEDLAVVLQQIEVAEQHAATLLAVPGTDPCAGLPEPGAHRLPAPHPARGLRTVDGSCNETPDPSGVDPAAPATPAAPGPDAAHRSCPSLSALAGIVARFVALDLGPVPPDLGVGARTDLSQTYASHPAHQVFLREYANNSAARPVATGALLRRADGGMGTWGLLKTQAAQLLGLRLADQDVHDVPLIAADPYGRFIPGPARGLAQYVTTAGLVEGDTTSPVPPPGTALRTGIPFLAAIAPHAVPAAPGIDGGTPPDPPRADPAPGTSDDGDRDSYDDEMLGAHFVSGDGRANENIGLTAVHEVFHAEHDRLVADVKRVLVEDVSPAGRAALAGWRLRDGADGWNGERLFQAARLLAQLEYEHLVHAEFGPRLAPSPPGPGTAGVAGPAEAAHTVLGLAQSLLADPLGRVNDDGTANPVPLRAAALDPPAYTRRTPDGPSGVLSSMQAAGAILRGTSAQPAADLDELVLDRLPDDVASLAPEPTRAAGTPALNEVRSRLSAATGRADLAPHRSWVDFGRGLRRAASLVDFVAAHGRHPSVVAATTVAAKRAAARLLVDPSPAGGTAPAPGDAADFLAGDGAWRGRETGVDEVDLWIGGAAERPEPGAGSLGPTLQHVLAAALAGLRDQDRLSYPARSPSPHLLAEIEDDSFADLVSRTTGAAGLRPDLLTPGSC